MLEDLRPRGVGEILDTAVTLFRARFWPLVRIALIVAIPTHIFTVLVTLSSQPDSNAAPAFVPGASPIVVSDANDIWIQLAAYVTILLTTWLATTFITAYATRIVADAYVDSAELPKEVLLVLRGRIFPILGLGIITSLFVGLGTLACGIPGLIAQVFFAVSMPALILEGIGVFKAIGRSCSLTKHKWWQSAAVYLAGSALTSVVTFGLAVAFQVLLDRLLSGNTGSAIGLGLANTIASVFTTPYLATALVVLYLDLRIRAEGFDVALLLAQLDAPAPTAAVN